MSPDDTRTRVSVHTADDGRPQLRLEHRYAYSVHRVWQALTDSTEHTRWFGVRTKIEPVAGGAVRFWLGEHPEDGEVLEVRPPRLLVHTGRGDVFRWELTPDTYGCRLVLLDTVAEPAHLPWSAAGFHGALDLLEMHLDGDDPAAARRGEDGWFDEMLVRYTKILRSDDDRAH